MTLDRSPRAGLTIPSEYSETMSARQAAILILDANPKNPLHSVQYHPQQTPWISGTRETQQMLQRAGLELLRSVEVGTEMAREVAFRSRAEHRRMHGAASVKSVDISIGIEWVNETHGSVVLSNGIQVAQIVGDDVDGPGKWRVSRDLTNDPPQESFFAFGPTWYESLSAFTAVINLELLKDGIEPIAIDPNTIGIPNDIGEIGLEW